MIFVPCFLENPSTGKHCMIDAILDTGSQRSAISDEVFDILALDKGDETQVQGSAGISEGWETKCRVILTENDLWDTVVDVLPQLPVHMVIGMDIISTGNLSLTYEEDGYTLRFEQL